ncbi:hypothetical protein Tco_0727550 [Tanacetum coccineum]|uniref:Transposase (putative) gypsy type domain-containing protein n=1 Tax=Tanacetum coccineum TaxID=301880 RepID=A0ABQ4YIM2_9ASTR
MPPCMRDRLVKLECTPVSLITLTTVSPFSTVFVSVLTHFRIPFSQLSVFGSAKVSHFEILCRVCNIEPDVSLFRYFYTHNYKNGWFGFTKRPNVRACYSKNLDSVKNWNDYFFWVDEFVVPADARFNWFLGSNIVKDRAPAPSEYNVEHWDTVQSGWGKKMHKGKYNCSSPVFLMSMLCTKGRISQGRFLGGNVRIKEDEERPCSSSSLQNSLYVDREDGLHKNWSSFSVEMSAAAPTHSDFFNAPALTQSLLILIQQMLFPLFYQTSVFYDNNGECFELARFGCCE